MDDDDVNYHDRLERQLSIFKDHPEVDVIVAKHANMDEDGIQLDYSHDIP